MNSRYPCIFLVLIAACSIGCGNSSSGKLVVARNLNASEVAARAMATMDSNTDGKIDDSELISCQALKDAFKRFDSNRDGALTSSEIEARFQEYQSQTDLISLSVQILHQKIPLAGAEVVFEPEPFMQEGLQSYRGITDDSGQADIVGETIEAAGLPLGLYRVRVTHAGKAVNAELGCEVAEDDPTGNRKVFAL